MEGYDIFFCTGIQGENQKNMSVKLYRDSTAIIAYANRTDGDFGSYAKSFSSEHEKARYDFSKKIGIDLLTTIIPSGSSIKMMKTPGAPYVFGQGFIYKKCISRTQGIGILTADCPTLIITDSSTQTIGILHLGWWQIYRNYTHKFCDVWKESSHPTSENVKIFIGPSICSECFTLTGIKGFIRRLLFLCSPLRKFLITKNGIWSIDLREAIKYQIEKTHLSPVKAEVFKTCTFEDEHFASYRREGKGQKNRNFIVVGI